MAHVEDKSAYDLCVKQTEDLANECFIIAERIVRASAKRMNVEAGPELLGSVPMVATEIRATIMSAAGMIGNSSPEKADRMIGDIDLALAALARRNREAAREA